MNNPPNEPRFVTCRCQYCDAGIEFDASDFGERETRAVQCPHCGKETLVFVPTPSMYKDADFVCTTARLMGLQIDDHAIELIVRSSLGTPTDMLRRLKYVADFSDTGRASITADVAAVALQTLAHKEQEAKKDTTAALEHAEHPFATLNQTTPELEPLMPKQFSDFIGQDRIKARLELAITAAKHRREPLGHVLLIGSPGSGKATLANILAKEMGANVKAVSGQTIEKAGDLAGLLTNLEEGDLLFIDEIHRLPKTIAEYLEAAKTFHLWITIDQGANARSVRLNLPRFTLIGSTTNKERLMPNFLSCFQIVENMDDYAIDELAAIAYRFAKSLEVEIGAEAAGRIARSADGTPLDILNRLRHVRDFAHVKGNGKITLEVTEAALKMLASHNERQDATENRDAIPSEIRREVWRRDEGKCVKCGSRKNLEYDHIIPVSRGGSNTARNIELLCEACNRSKSDLIQ